MNTTAKELADYLDDQAPDYNSAGHSPRVARSRAERVGRRAGGPPRYRKINQRRRPHGR